MLARRYFFVALSAFVSKLSCSEMAHNGITLGLLADLLGFSNTEIYCNSWSKSDFAAFIPDNLNVTVGYNPRRIVERHKSLILCLDGTGSATEYLRGGNESSRYATLILYENDDDLETLNDIPISLKTDFFLLSTRTWELQDVYDLNGRRWKKVLGNVNARNETEIAALKEALRGMKVSWIVRFPH